MNLIRAIIAALTQLYKQTAYVIMNLSFLIAAIPVTSLLPAPLMVLVGGKTGFFNAIMLC